VTVINAATVGLIKLESAPDTRAPFVSRSYLMFKFPYGATLPSALLLAALTLLGGCATDSQWTSHAAGVAPVPVPITPQLVALQDQQRRGKSVPDISRLRGTPRPYRIGPSDILSITVWGHPELAAAQLSVQTPLITAAEQAAAAASVQGFVVSPQGMLQFPFAGKLKVAGLTEIQARDLLVRSIAHMINQPNVTLRVQSYRSQRIYVDGEVRLPGLHAINDIPMTLVEALNRAGGILPSGDQSRIAVHRAGVDYLVSLPDLLRQGGDPAAILLQHGDLVRVHSSEESKVFVTGEVMTPKALTMHSGRLTLNEAIGEAGGINPVSGDAHQVYVVRRDGETPQIFQLDARDPGALALAEHFELSPRDTVYVAQSGLANWHRTVSLLIPGSLPSALSLGKQ
jgi:polysaccharide export outer membrane protein